MGNVDRGLPMYFSLASANPNDAPALIEKAAEEIAAVKKSGNNPGLATQLDLQLERLRDEALPDLQFLYTSSLLPIPAHARWKCKCNSPIPLGSH